MMLLQNTIEELLALKKEKNIGKLLYLHLQLHSLGLETNNFLGNSISSALAQVGSFNLAHQVLIKLECQHTSLWNCFIVSWVQYGKYRDALGFYQKLRVLDTMFLSSNACIALLKACSSMKDLERGQEIHSDIYKVGMIENDIYVGSTLVHMYASCGLLGKAYEVLERLPVRNVVSWNALIAGNVEQGYFKEALKHFEQMQLNEIVLNAVTLVCCLKACGSIRDVKTGCELHAMGTKCFLDQNVYVASTLVDMYSKCGYLTEAQETFDKLEVRNTVSWNTLIAAYTEHGFIEEAVSSIHLMQREGVPMDSITFLSILRACGNVGYIHLGKEMFSEICKRGYETDLHISSILVDFYARCGCLSEAEEIFNKVQVHTLMSWTSLIMGYVNSGIGDDALHCFKEMQNEGFSPDGVTYAAALIACHNPKATTEGQNIHAEIVKKGILDDDMILGSALVDMYAKCGLLLEASGVFDNLLIRDSVSWNALVSGFVENGYDNEALDFSKQMQQDDVTPDAVTFISCLKACSNVGVRVMSYDLHLEIVKRGISGVEIENAIVTSYARLGCIVDASHVFWSLPSHDVASWNAIIAGCIENGDCKSALNFIQNMRKDGISFDVVTLICSLKVCNVLQKINKVQEIHAETVSKGIEEDTLISNTLISVYGNFNHLIEAQYVFDKLPLRTVVSWNSLIGGYIDWGHSYKVLKCFDNMGNEGISPDASTFLCLLKAYISLGDVFEGQEVCSMIYIRALERENLIGNMLLDFYAKHGLIYEAQYIFENVSVRNTESWTSLIRGYADSWQNDKALLYFRLMHVHGVAPDALTLVCCLTICGNINDTITGRQIHAEIVKKGFLEAEAFVGSNLVDAYVKWDSLAEAQNVLNGIQVQDIISWNSLITGYVDQECVEKAHSCFKQMEQRGVSHDTISFICILTVCGKNGSIEDGTKLYIEIVKKGYEEHPQLVNTLVDMYLRQGMPETAQWIFDKFPNKDLVSWNAVIAGHGQLGESDKMFYNLDRMIRESLEPDTVTFVSLLNSCSHTGLVSDGYMSFAAMLNNYSIIPTHEHYNCIIDLLGRAGQIENAALVIREMPFQPSLLVWHTILAGCRKWRNVEIGRHAFEHALDLNKEDAASYVYIGNMYA